MLDEVHWDRDSVESTINERTSPYIDYNKIGSLGYQYHHEVVADDDSWSDDSVYEDYEDYFDDFSVDDWSTVYDDHDWFDEYIDETFYTAWFGHRLWGRIIDIGPDFTSWMTEAFSTVYNASRSGRCNVQASLPTMLYDRFAEAESGVASGRLDLSRLLNDELSALPLRDQKRLLLSVLSEVRIRMCEMSRRKAISRNKL